MEVYFKPLGDRVLVLAENQSKENKSKSGLILTDSVQRGQKVQGKVVAVGGGVFSQSGQPIPMTVQYGDIVLYKKDEASDKVKLAGVEYLLFREHELLGIIE
jgi:co-chaperonin GroES (HSP10)